MVCVAARGLAVVRTAGGAHGVRGAAHADWMPRCVCVYVCVHLRVCVRVLYVARCTEQRAMQGSSTRVGAT
jgi:hypothetical protein